MPSAEEGRTTIAKVRALKARFDANHVQGMAALQRKDFDALDAAIRREYAIIEEQSVLLTEQRTALAAQQQRLLRRSLPIFPT